MKQKVLALSIITGLVFSASALATTPGSYDTKFNVSANVPEGAYIADASGKPITDVDVELTPAASGKMETTTQLMKLWNNDVNKLEVTLIMDDSQAGTGDKFTLYTGGESDTLGSMTYQISTVSSAGTKAFAASGDTQDYTLTANGTHGELPVKFKFVSDKNYTDLGQGNYTGVVYANLNAKA